MLMQMSHPLVAPETKIRGRGARGVCLLIRNETVYRKQQYEKKNKRYSEIRKPVTPARVLFRANV